MSGVEIRSDEITPYLERLTPKSMALFLDRARETLGPSAAEGSKSAYAWSEFPYTKTGNLWFSIGWRRMRSRAVVGFVAGPMRGKGAKGYHRHLVEAGTRPHRIRFPWEKAAGVPKNMGSIMHPGAKPNPWMTRGRPRIIDRVSREWDRLVKEELA